MVLIAGVILALTLAGLAAAACAGLQFRFLQQLNEFVRVRPKAGRVEALAVVLAVVLLHLSQAMIYGMAFFIGTSLLAGGSLGGSGAHAHLSFHAAAYYSAVTF